MAQANNQRRNGDTEKRRFAFLVEQTLGHTTHYKNLRAAIDADPSVTAAWYPISYPLAQKAVGPSSKNGNQPEGQSSAAWRQVQQVMRFAGAPFEQDAWTVWASMRARNELMRDRASTRYEALYFHTEPTTWFCTSLMRRVPSVISLDSTPRQFRALGDAYGHQPSASPVERLKHALYMRSFKAACAFIAISDWTRQSLITDYGIDSSRITIIPFGINLDMWRQSRSLNSTNRVRVLFVGGDFARKGGQILLRAFNTAFRTRCELHIVTKEAVEAEPGVHIYHGVKPNSSLLKRLYATADLFVLPTLGDCSSIAIQEAMAAGLPVISTNVGGISELVHDGDTGLLTPPGDVRALISALEVLLSDSTKRQSMGVRGQVVAENKFDGTVNAGRILHLMASISDNYGHEYANSTMHDEAAKVIRNI